MKRTFEAATIQDALSLVSAELGKRARILDTTRLHSPGIFGFGKKTRIRVTASSPKPPPVPPSESKELIALRSQVEILKSRWNARELIRKPSSRGLLRLERAARAAGWREETVQAMLSDVEGINKSGNSRRTIRRILELWLSTQIKSTDLRLGDSFRSLMVVGPTGVGKTTTLAKLAGKALRGRSGSVALLSLDTERVGGTDLLRTFADILDVPFARVHSRRDVPKFLQAMTRIRHLFIDTPGLSPFQSDPGTRIQECLADLSVDETLLVLPLCTRGSEASRIIKTYRPLTPTAMVVTKLDETGNIPALLDICRATELPLSHITSGPKATGDLEPADAEEMARWISEDLLKTTGQEIA